MKRKLNTHKILNGEVKLAPSVADNTIYQGSLPNVDVMGLIPEIPDVNNKLITCFTESILSDRAHPDFVKGEGFKNNYYDGYNSRTHNDAYDCVEYRDFGKNCGFRAIKKCRKLYPELGTKIGSVNHYLPYKDDLCCEIVICNDRVEFDAYNKQYENSDKKLVKLREYIIANPGMDKELRAKLIGCYKNTKRAVDELAKSKAESSSVCENR